MEDIDDIGFHFVDGELTVNLNQVFFDDIYETSDVVIAVDGYLVLEDDIGESLRQETLHRLHMMYKKHGIRFVEKIRTGKFNLLVHDKNREKLYVANDYFGQLPFYYTTCEPFQFSSNILNLPFREIDWYALSQYLKYGNFLRYETQDRYIRVLSPHAIVAYDMKRPSVEVRSYTPQNVTISRDVEELFRRGCQRLYTDEIEYALNLSGGIDSRFVLFHWPNKQELTAITGCPEQPDAAQREDVRLAKELTSNLDIKQHRILRSQTARSKEQVQQLFDTQNPFDIRKPEVSKTTAPGFNVRLSGGFAPPVSGEFLLLRDKRYYLTILFGIPFRSVSRSLLDRVRTKIPGGALQRYLVPEVYEKLTAVPVPFEHVDIEAYHMFMRERRRHMFKFSRAPPERLFPFLDYDFYFSCMQRNDRVNNKLYYSLLQKMSPEYKILTTRYAFPLNAPRRLQVMTKYVQEIKKKLCPGSQTVEQVGGVIAKEPRLHRFMVDHIEAAGIADNVDALAERVSGGRHGYFFYLLFVLSYWLQKMRDEYTDL